MRTLLAHLEDDSGDGVPALAPALLARGLKMKKPAAKKRAATNGAGTSRAAIVRPNAKRPPNPTAAARVSVTRTGRASKAATRLDDSDAFLGPARSFRSTPIASKAPMPTHEMFIPPYAAVGARIIVQGNHAGGTRPYFADVLEHRAKFPRIVVRFIQCVQTGQTHTLALPTPAIAHVHAGLIASPDEM